MSYCAGCDPNVYGVPHTCEESGVAVAEQAYAAGAVEPAAAPLIFDVQLACVVEGETLHAASAAADLRAWAERCPYVSEYATTIAERK